jgi:hypothetical protein
LSNIQHGRGDSRLNEGKALSVLSSREGFAMVLLSTDRDGAKLGHIDEGLHEYYSPGKTQSVRNKIATFAQYATETISEAFERFNEYTRVVPRHKFLKEDLVQKFYQGLTMESRTIIDASAGGSIMELTPTQASTLFKKVADNDTWASSGRLLPVQLRTMCGSRTGGWSLPGVMSD